MTPPRRSRRRLRVTRRGWAVLGVLAVAAGASSVSLLRDPGDPGPAAEGAGLAPTPSVSVTATAVPTPDPGPPPLPGPSAPRVLSDPLTRVTVPAGTDPTHHAATAFFDAAPVVVVTDGSSRALDVGAWVALRFRSPLLQDGPGVGAVLRRLGVATALTVGEVGELGVDDVRPITFQARDAGWSEPSSGRSVAETALAGRWGVHRLRGFMSGDPPVARVALGTVAPDRGAPWRPADGGVAVLVRAGDDGSLAAAVSAVAAGHRVATIANPDPRADPRATRELAGLDLDRLVLLGAEDAWPPGTENDLPWQLAVARTGTQLPGGGQIVFPGRRFVALYGTPGSGALGVLGEQSVAEAVSRAREQAAAYARYSDVPVIPTFEIIATVASASGGPDGDYSTERAVEDLAPWVDAAEAAGLYVVLDLQPGRSDFLVQAQRYEGLLIRPHVGLALDPEWRLGPTQRHLVQIGGVEAAEVNRVSDWLAGLVREHELPQKLFVVHQFKLSMIRNRADMVARPELATLIQMDGQGGQAVKLDTWRAIRRDPPAGVWWGWKNFHDEDTPTRTPADTMSLDPQPVFVSYQ